MAKYRKRPIIVEAYQWLGPSDYQPGVGLDLVTGDYYVTTIHDQRAYLEPGDYVIQEPDDTHYYPCKADIFERTYEADTVEE